MLIPSVAQAQTAIPTPTDEFLRQQERERQLRKQQEGGREAQHPRSDLLPTQAQIPQQEPNCIPVHRLELTGDGAAQFQWALDFANKLTDGTPDPATPRCLGSKGVNVVMRRIQNGLIGKGFSLSQVLLGPQARLNEGVLELTLFPGRLGHIELSNGTSPQANAGNAIPLALGDVINLRDLEQALENLNRLPSVESRIELSPADGADAEPGQSDLVVHWKQSAPWRANLSFDDAGSKTTGKYQAGLTLAYDHLLGFNDLFYVSLNHDAGQSGNDSGAYGTRGYTVHYSVPVGYWLWGVTQSSNRFEQTVAGANQTYRYSGMSQNSEIKLSRVVYRNAKHKSTASLAAWTKHSRNHIDDTEVDVQHRRMAGWDFGLSHRAFMGANMVNTNVVYRRGTGAWGALPAAEEGTGEGSARPQIITADIQLNAPLTVGKQALRYTGTWRGQYNKTPLIPLDRFSLGGRYTVRGFDGENQLQAERGWLVRNDLELPIGQTEHAFYMGLDYGQVAGPSSALLVGQHLSGAALGFRGTFDGFSYDVFAAKPISKPAQLQTPSSVAGFNLNYSF